MRLVDDGFRAARAPAAPPPSCAAFESGRSCRVAGRRFHLAGLHASLGSALLPWGIDDVVTCLAIQRDETGTLWFFILGRHGAAGRPMTPAEAAALVEAAEKVALGLERTSAERLVAAAGGSSHPRAGGMVHCSVGGDRGRAGARLRPRACPAWARARRQEIDGLGQEWARGRRFRAHVSGGRRHAGGCTRPPSTSAVGSRSSGGAADPAWHAWTSVTPLMRRRGGFRARTPWDVMPARRAPGSRRRLRDAPRLTWAKRPISGREPVAPLCAGTAGAWRTRGSRRRRQASERSVVVSDDRAYSTEA